MRGAKGTGSGSEEDSFVKLLSLFIKTLFGLDCV